MKGGLVILLLQLLLLTTVAPKTLADDGGSGNTLSIELISVPGSSLPLNDGVPTLRTSDSKSKIVCNGTVAGPVNCNYNFTNAKGRTFYGVVYFGTPPQPISCLLDTGSSDLWVPGYNCTYSGCAGKTLFYSNKSSTFVPNGKAVNIYYGSGSVKGNLEYDTCSISNFSIAGQGFVTAYNMSGFSSTPWSCVLGMGHPTLSVSRTPTVIANMVSKNLTTNTFSFYFPRNITAKQPGVMTLGGSNKTFYSGNITYSNLTSNNWYQYSIDHIYVGNSRTDYCTNCSTTTNKNGTQGIADTGTGVLTVPTMPMYTAINQALGGTLISGSYTFNCTNLTSATNTPYKNLTFVMSGNNYTLAPWQYTFPYSLGQKNCVSVLYYFSLRDTSNRLCFIMGQPFMEAWYTVFDLVNNRIGYAKSANLN